MPRFMLTRQNLEIVEIRQVHRVINVSSSTGRKVFLGDYISYGAYFSAVLVWLK